MSEQLNALDATFLELEEADQGAHMHIGGVMVFEPETGRTSAVGVGGGCPAGARAGAAAALPGPALIPDHGRLLLALLARGRALPGRQPRTGGEPAAAGRPGGAARMGRRVLLRAPRSGAAALGDGRSGGARRRALGAGQQDASLHGRRDRLRRHHSARARHRAATGRRVAPRLLPVKRPPGTGAALAAAVADRSGDRLGAAPRPRRQASRSRSQGPAPD